MLRFLVLAALLLVPCAGAPDKKSKPPEIELVSGALHRQGEDIMVDGKVRNCGDKPIKGLIIYFHFFDADQRPLTTARGGIEQDVFAPGDDSEFHAQVEAPPKATHYQIQFMDNGGKILRTPEPMPVKAIE